MSTDRRVGAHGHELHSSQNVTLSLGAYAAGTMLLCVVKGPCRGLLMALFLGLSPDWLFGGQGRDGLLY